MLKTYREDFAYVARLLKSYHLYNSDHLPLFIVVPKKDLVVFAEFESPTVLLISDESIPVDYAIASPDDDASLGILNAGVSKLGFWKLGLCNNYFAIDSDMVFIRPFGKKDFLSTSGYPYLAITESLFQKVDPFYFSRYWTHRDEGLLTVSRILKTNEGSNAPSIHCSQVMNSEILQSLEDFLRGQGNLDYKELMSLALYEFFWYTSWARHQNVVKIVTRDELVKMVHHQGEHLALWDLGVREKDLARGYLGVIVNSNWSRQYGIVDFDSPPREDYTKAGKWAEWRNMNLP